MKPLILAAGFMFILVGLHILTEENPTYETQIGPLYAGFVYAFYLYIAFLFLATLVTVLKALLELRSGKKN
jgi:hypothetical protein